MDNQWVPQNEKLKIPFIRDEIRDLLLNDNTLYIGSRNEPVKIIEIE